jgi:hypothetical protein
MVATTFTTPPGASVWEEEMLRYLAEHVRREGSILYEYEKLASTTSSKALAYAMNVLLEDERRHHAWFGQLAETIRTEASLSADEPPIPWLDLAKEDRSQLEGLLSDLLRNERVDAVELKRLRKELRDFETTTLWTLVVDLMQRDTDKHIALIRTLQKLTKESTAA